MHPLVVALGPSYSTSPLHDELSPSPTVQTSKEYMNAQALKQNNKKTVQYTDKSTLPAPLVLQNLP